MRRTAVAGLVGGVLVLVLAGCSANSAAGVESGPAAGDVAQAPVGAGQAVGPAAPQPGKNESGGSASGQSAAGSAALPQSAVVPGRQVVRSASITVSVPNVPGAAARATGIAAAAGGYTASANTDDSTATLTLQVPQAHVDQVLRDLAGLGHVTRQGAAAQDVTDQFVDVHSRIATQQASVARVRALLAKAGSIGDIVSIEGELTQREADLESLEQRAAELTGQVTMSAITVQLGHATAQQPLTEPVRSSGFLAGLSSGWHAFLDALGVALVVVGAVLPFALILGVPAVAVWWWLRRRRVLRAPDVHSAG
jgi:hypothetical protein